MVFVRRTVEKIRTLLDLLLQFNMKFYKTKSDVWYYLLAYCEVMEICLYGDILPSDSKLMHIAQETFCEVYQSQIFYSFNFLLLFAAFVYFLYRQSTQKIFRLSWLVVCVSSLVLVTECALKHPTGIVYLSLCFSYLFISVVFELIKMFANKQTTNDAGKMGFATDWCQTENLQDVGWKTYAESLLERLEKTNTGNTSFAVALTGKWGTGKTTFFDYMKAAMRTHGAAYMEFNPWLSSSSDNIVKDYFQTLNGKLKEKGIYIEDDIAEYVRLLLQWCDKTLFQRVDDVLGVAGNRNLASKRQRLSDGLNYLESKLYVLVDDIDRLQKEEIFEVLKLIRHTADFQHIVYVVTCDKEYVVESLSNIPITRPTQYLQKIFQLELAFPMYEGYLLTHLFNTELISHTHYEANLQNQLNQLEMELNRNKIYLRNYLTNFRDAKRLVNEFILNLDYIVKQGVVADFNIKDLFLIHLLEFAEAQGYKTFRDNIEKLLHTCTFNTKYFEFTDSKENLEKCKISERTQHLLTVMFPKLEWGKPRPPRNSIRRTDKLYTYFSYRPYAYQMSLTDFSHLMKNASKDDIETYVKESNIGIFSKGKSIYDLMREQRLAGVDNTTVTNFITLLVSWTGKYISYDSNEIGRLYRDVLSKSSVDEKHVALIKKILAPFFEKLQNSTSGCHVLQKIYCKMMPCSVCDSYEAEIFPVCIYEENELRERISQNTQAFLKRVRPSINQLLENSRLHLFIEDSIVYNESGARSLFAYFPIEDDLLAYFLQTKAEHDIRLFLDKFELSNYPEDLSENQEEAMHSDIRKYFATVNFYKRLLQECFAHEDGSNILNEYFSRNKL